jgi:transglutaminase-like putative cysteine protease
MLIRIGYELKFNIPAPTTMFLLLHTYPDRYVLPKAERLVTDPSLPLDSYLDQFGNRATRLLAPQGLLTLTNDAIVEVDGKEDPIPADAKEHSLMDLPSDVGKFLYPSRYCDVDRLEEFAWSNFSDLAPGYARVQAIVDFAHKHIEFGYAYANSSKSAFDAFQEKKGVCRDYAHLAITLCRCMGIPARYATGYLGDIGVPLVPPMDFSAWFEVYLSNSWHTFDARHNKPRIGRIVMAYGRDAADCALSTTFSPTSLEHFFVVTDEIVEGQ